MPVPEGPGAPRALVNLGGLAAAAFPTAQAACPTTMQAFLWIPEAGGGVWGVLVEE